MAITIRRAVKEDMTHVRDMIQELADFEKMSDSPKLSVEDLIRDAGFDSTNLQRPAFYCFVAEENSDDTSNPLQCSLTPAGYALCFDSYSMHSGKTLFLEDIYVRPSFRSKGVGKALFLEVLKFGKANECSKLLLHVLDWNPAKKFYKKLNGVDLTKDDEVDLHRFDENAINKLVEN